MKLAYLLTVWLHVLAAATWLGGMVFLVLVLVPVTRQAPFAGLASVLIEATGRRFRRVGWIALVVLVASGLVQLAYRGFTWADALSGRLWYGSFGQVLAIKLLLVAAILVLSAVHDFRLGPRASALWKAQPNSLAARRLRRWAAWIARLNLLLALAVVLLGVMLVRGGP